MATTGRSSDRTDAESKNAMEEHNKYPDARSFVYLNVLGNSFHTSPARKGQSLSEAQLTHEHRMALKGRIDKGMHVLDCGCGAGGPARSIATLTGARVTGINISKYELNAAREVTKKMNLEHLCDFKEASFDELPFDEGTFDRVISIEAVLHAKDSRRVFSEIYRVLKPGGIYISHDWAMKEKYDESNSEHRQIIKSMVDNYGLYGLETTSKLEQFFRDCGFNILETGDFSDDSQVHWTEYLEQEGGLLTSWLGDRFFFPFIYLLETLRIAPKGTLSVVDLMDKAKVAMIRGGKLGILTSMAMFIVQKPAA
ncbi:uncharacterized protein LOC134183534 [Corticium candelabrum]|uniref:uncharacterized protein LOC134183534 n=1 Tax=Corticium candelabrum TaxID=121492 RepID=UPI002E25A111|nr:uncharacterized protein LOC134183534 [Corticium candelabrum]